MFRFYRTQFVVLASLFTFAVLSTPAYADKAAEALAKANRHLQDGVPAKAIELINTTLKSGNVPSDLAARALLMRAQAQEKLGKYAYALADYNQAVWQGLPERNKAEAEQGRNRIMARLGVGGDSAPQKTTSTGSGTSLAASSGWGTSEIQTTPSEERTGGIGSVFSGIFGGTDASETESPASVTRPRAQNVNAVVASRAVRAPVKSSSENVAIAVNNEASGDFAIQMAALHSEDGAIYEVDRIEKRYGEWLGGRTPSITVLGTSDGGTLYKVIAEPFQHGEGIATCELLKTKGLSCMLISR